MRHVSHPRRGGIVRKTWINHQDKLARLYEHGAGKTVLSKYERRGNRCLSPIVLVLAEYFAE